MKKYYLALGLFCITAAALAQGPANVPASASSSDPQTPSQEVSTDVAQAGGNVTQTKKVTNRGNVDHNNHIEIGSSFYDLQTNYAMSRRIILHADGSISAAWTTSPNDQSGYPLRGTGFNFKSNAGNWSTPSSSRVENNARTGWPCIGLLSDGREFVIGHEATQGGFFISKAATVGARPTGATLILQETPYKPIWARSANNGDTIHLIYSYTDSAAAGEKRAPTRKGVFAPMVYSRSLDGGTTWDIQHIMLPDYDSTITNNGGADQYAIDCQGSTVVVANADLLQGVLVWKSTDFGTTWTRTIVDTFFYAPYNAKKLMTDTPFTNDGTVDVLLDNNGNMNVFWGLGRVLDTDTTDESYSFFPGVQGIVHWSEVDKTSRLIASGGPFDRNENGFNDLEAATYAALTTTGIPTNVATVARLGNTSAMRQPSASIDANGNIYCVFSVPIEGDISDLSANFRDIGIVYSTNGGTTWSTPQNVTQLRNNEDDFACVARRSNNFVHMMWQRDEYPGTNLQNNSTSAGNHPTTENKIMYTAIPVTDILQDQLGMQFGLKVEEPNTGEVMLVSQNYPNPTSGLTQITVNLNMPGDLNLVVRNAAGVEVKNFTLSNLYRGTHSITVDASDLAAGVYTYSITAGGSTITNSMLVK
jgi:Secretion system C-terminal sorting domain